LKSLVWFWIIDGDGGDQIEDQALQIGKEETEK
jgi:hypothetical protein